MSEPDEAGSTAEFRRRVDALFADTRATTVRSGPARRDAGDVLDRRVAHSLESLGAPCDGDALRLRRSLTLHDGRIVAMDGDHVSLEPEESTQVVTTVTTVLAGGRMRTETTVLVFDLVAEAGG